MTSTNTATGPPDSLQLFKALVKRGDAAGLRALLDAHPTLRTRLNDNLFDFDAPAVVFSAGRNDGATLDVLLDAGADPNAKSGWWAGGFGALHVASGETAEHLINRGARLDAHAAAHLGKFADLKRIVDAAPALVQARGGDGQTPLHFARTPEIAAHLLDRGAEIDARDLDHHSTPAQWAVKDRHDVVRYLMSRGATPDEFMAAAIGDMNYLRNALLGDPALLRAKSDAKRFPGPKPPGAEHIYAYVIDADTTLLHAASRYDQTEVIDLLIAVGLDVDVRGGYDDGTPLHTATWHHRTAAAAALLDRGAGMELESGPIHRNTPLGWAIVAGSVDVTRLLLDRGAAMRDYYLANAHAGLRGDFASFARHVPEHYTRIIEMLEARAGART